MEPSITALPVKVDLPQPDGPMMATNSPAFTESEAAEEALGVCRTLTNGARDRIVPLLGRL